jgi:hypothetical protein
MSAWPIRKRLVLVLVRRFDRSLFLFRSIISGSSQLTRLSLVHTSVTDGGLKALADAAALSLRRLDLGHLRHITDEVGWDYL